MSEETPQEEEGQTEAEHEATTAAEPPEQDTPLTGEPDHPEETPDEPDAEVDSES